LPPPSHPTKLAAMELDLLGTHADRAYAILSSLVTPRPIAWVSTLHPHGRVNAAPFSFFNVFGSKPPLLVFAPGDRPDGSPKDSARLAEEHGEFVVNLVSPPLAEAMVASSAPLPPGESETEAGGLETRPSSVVRPPRLAAAPAAFECRTHSVQRIGRNRLVLGIVERAHVDDALIDPDTLRVDPEKHTPVGRMASPDYYCHSDRLFRIPRPT